MFEVSLSSIVYLKSLYHRSAVIRKVFPTYPPFLVLDYRFVEDLTSELLAA